MPANEEELLNIHGIKDVKKERYRKDLLEILDRYRVGGLT
jgi:hypothetical protein